MAWPASECEKETSASAVRLSTAGYIIGQGDCQSSLQCHLQYKENRSRSYRGPKARQRQQREKFEEGSVSIY